MTCYFSKILKRFQGLTTNKPNSVRSPEGFQDLLRMFVISLKNVHVTIYQKRIFPFLQQGDLHIVDSFDDIQSDRVCIYFK